MNLESIETPTPLARALHWIGAPIYEQASTWIDIFILFCKTLRRLPQLQCWRWHDILQAIVHSGIGSLPIIVVSTAVAGVVVTNEIAWHMDAALHTITMIPGFAGQFIFLGTGNCNTSTPLGSESGSRYHGRSRQYESHRTN